MMNLERCFQQLPAQNSFLLCRPLPPTSMCIFVCNACNFLSI